MTGAVRFSEIQERSGLLLAPEEGGIGFRFQPRGGAFNTSGSFRLLGEARKELVVLYWLIAHSTSF
jgi:hypothetical protein